MNNRIAIFSGNANPALARAVINKIAGRPVSIDMITEAEIGHFSDGETKVKILRNVRGVDCYVVHPTCPPVNHNVMELLIIIDALRRASAGSITAVMPYYGYGRQDRQPEPRTPITSSLVADLLQTAGMTRGVTLDLHAKQIQGFFHVPEDNLFATPVLLPYLQEHYADAVVVSPDAGGVERALVYAKRLGGSIAIIIKRRERANESKVMHVIGEVSGRRCVILDDMFDTCGTLVGAANALLAKGATEVAAAGTHAIFSGNAMEAIREAPLKEIIVTDTAPLSSDMLMFTAPDRWTQKVPKLTVLTVADLLAEAIWRIHTNDSLSNLFV